MPDYILQFFNSPYWAPISNVFTAIGVISVILAIIRFVHNRRRKEWKSNVFIQDYPTDYDVEMECRNGMSECDLFENMDRGADGGHINDCIQAGGLCDTKIGGVWI